MKTWQNYEEFLLEGEWHIHTSYTDGKNTVDDYCQKATKLKLPLIAFTEHVRYDIDYDFNELLKEINDARLKYDLIILSGIEAKVLPGGKLDVRRDILHEVDYSILAVHSFPVDLDLYLQSLEKALKNEYINAWAHPGSFLKRKNLKLSNDQLRELLHICKDHKVLLETNKRYGTPFHRWRTTSKEFDIKYVKGSNVHSVDAM